MTRAEREVIEAAREWWRGRRPAAFDRTAHLENPTVNAHGNYRDERLAHAVGKLEAERTKATKKGKAKR